MECTYERMYYTYIVCMYVCMYVCVYVCMFEDLCLYEQSIHYLCMKDICLYERKFSDSHTSLR
jgi:hypothetical protein